VFSVPFRCRAAQKFVKQKMSSQSDLIPFAVAFFALLVVGIAVTLCLHYRNVRRELHKRASRMSFLTQELKDASIFSPLQVEQQMQQSQV